MRREPQRNFGFGDGALTRGVMLGYVSWFSMLCQLLGISGRFLAGEKDSLWEGRSADWSAGAEFAGGAGERYRGLPKAVMGTTSMRSGWMTARVVPRISLRK